MVCACHVGGTRGSGIMSSAADVLEMRVVCGMRGVGGVCEMGKCLARGTVGGEGGEWNKRIGFGFYQSCKNTGSVGRVYVYGLR